MEYLGKNHQRMEYLALWNHRGINFILKLFAE